MRLVACSTRLLLWIVLLDEARSVTGYECTRPECLQQAARLAESIDPGIEPCRDFVGFACGGAFAKYEATASRDRDVGKTSSHAIHLWWIRRRIMEQLDLPYRVEEHRAIGLAKMYWQSCKMTSAREALAGVRILLKRLGGWPLITENWQEQHFTWHKFGKCARLLGFLPRMFLHIGLNDEEVDKPWYSNDTVELTVERSKYMQNRADARKTLERAHEYYKVAEFLAEMRKPDIAEIDEALQFGKRIHMLTHSQGTPLIELKVTSIAKLQSTYPFVDWMDYIRSMLTRRQANYLSDRNCVIADVCYLSQIGALLDSTDKRVQANYAFLSIIDDLTLFIRPQLSLAFATSQDEIEQICFDSVAVVFRKAIEMILAILAGQQLRHRVNEIATIVAEQARQLFEKIPWMDHQTRLQAVKKSERTGFVNLFANDIFEDRYFDRLEFTQPNATLVLFRELNVFLVDRYYLQLGRPRNSYILYRKDNRTTLAIFKTPFSAAETRVRPDRISNQVYVPAGAVLQERFSVHEELDFLNYATIGLEIAEAMGQQIYQRGSYVDSNGNWRDASWWSKTTQRQFASRETCHELGKVKPIDEMSPIFGLIGAGEIAYKSMFERSLGMRNATLPGLNYTTRQLFWIAAVSADCDRNLERRYNAMVAHNANFADDFRCDIGEKMRPELRCGMWLG